MKTPTPRSAQEDNIHHQLKTSRSSRVILLKTLRRDKNNMDNKHQNKRRVLAAKDKCSSRLTLNKLVKVMGAVAIHLNSSSNMEPEGTVRTILTLNSSNNNMEVVHMEDSSSMVVSKAMEAVAVKQPTVVDSMEDKEVMVNRIRGVTHLSNLAEAALPLFLHQRWTKLELHLDRNTKS
jgi:hypothetical protein